MDNTITDRKRKWGFPRLIPMYYPKGDIESTADRMNWIAAVGMDRRLPDRSRRIVQRLGMHLNLETGRCDPTMKVLAMMSGLGESRSAEEMARRAVLEGEKLGWIRVRRRNGGAHTRSNAYALTISPAVLIPTNPA